MRSIEATTSDPKAGGRKAPPQPPVLFSDRGSMNIFVREMRSASGQAGLPITFQATFHIRLNPGSIDGSPEAALGCLAVLDEDFVESLQSVANEDRGRPSVPFRRVLREENGEVILEPVESAQKRLIALIRQQGNYGVKFCFLDDAEHADLLIQRMRLQAKKEFEAQINAQLVLAQQAGIQDPGVPLRAILNAERASVAKAAAGAT